MTRPLVIYHDNCPDGWAAAWAAWTRLGPHADYHGASYGEPPPDVTDRVVYIVDFSFKRSVLIDVANKAVDVTLLDHHKTAKEDLAPGADLPENLTIVFDMDRSGATMSWDYFQSKETRSWIVQYAEDRDLWKHKLMGTREINAYLQCLPKHFAVLDQAHAAGVDAAFARGTGCLAWVRYYIDSTKKAAVRQRFLGYPDIPVVNAPYTAISEVVGELSQETEAPFAVGWHVRPHPAAGSHVVYSLRSKGDFDVSELAERMGGGGHKAASGFQSLFYPGLLDEALAPRK